MKENNTDEQLMQLIGQGNQEAFRQLYERHARRLQGFFLRMLAYDEEKAKDFTQELFIKVYEQSPRFNEGKSLFTTWLYSMAYNLCKNEYRHQEVVEAYKAEHQFRDEPASSQGEGHLNTELMYEHLRRAIATLPAEQRTAFTLRYQEELPVKEIAHILQVPEGTIKSRLHYALLKVQEAMKPFK